MDGDLEVTLEDLMDHLTPGDLPDFFTVDIGSCEEFFKTLASAADDPKVTSRVLRALNCLSTAKKLDKTFKLGFRISSVSVEGNRLWYSDEAELADWMKSTFILPLAKECESLVSAPDDARQDIMARAEIFLNSCKLMENTRFPLSETLFGDYQRAREGFLAYRDVVAAKLRLAEFSLAAKSHAEFSLAVKANMIASARHYIVEVYNNVITTRFNIEKANRLRKLVVSVFNSFMEDVLSGVAVDDDDVTKDILCFLRTVLGGMDVDSLSVDFAAQLLKRSPKLQQATLDILTLATKTVFSFAMVAEKHPSVLDVDEFGLMKHMTGSAAEGREINKAARPAAVAKPDPVAASEGAPGESGDYSSGKRKRE